MVALIFFQLTAVIVILGAELNRGIYEFKRLGVMHIDGQRPPPHHAPKGAGAG
jgi:membrane protein